MIHTVGPVWNGGKKDEELLLRNCYINSLLLAAEYKCSTVAFPNISTGIYRFPKKLAAELSVKAINQFLESDNTIKQIKIVCFDDENFQLLSAIQPNDV
ncbi:O-acetyl-ADP-ribose deacetylase [Sphingobacterium thalpophilum]|uniref:O-acetyl-ADP-ribose deacetylase n=1 Tax=Sphingobacterium thalpophilum TaxID=259 RepID=A0A4U9VU02_9SPHI|nr:O-acetyl-ADP-ribose deacetylase [Sphingobacterium thalpophilum]